MSNLKNIRQKKNISQKALADRLKVSQSLIAQYERGQRRITPYHALLLSEVFSCDPVEILETAEEKDRFFKWIFTLDNNNLADNIVLIDYKQDQKTGVLNDHEQTLINNYRSLNKKGREMLLELSDDMASNEKYKQ